MYEYLIEPIKNQIKELEDSINNTEKLLLEAQNDDLKALAQAELDQLNFQKLKLLETISQIEAGTYNPSEKNSNDSKQPESGDCIIEIRAGAGGDEAGLFANDLYEAYLKYAEKKSFNTSTLYKNEGGIGNIKEVVFELKSNKSPAPFELFKNESGVHRVQRVPATESSGRIHTSTVTVAVLPIVTDVEIEIRPEDLKMDTYRASGAGGQHVNKTESAVRITHIPTGVVVTCQDERSQYKNRDRAMSILKSKLYDMMQSQQKSSVDELRAEQVGTGERSEKIRTYNYPQDRITDHRIKKSWGNIKTVMSGEFDNIFRDLNVGMKKE